MLPAALMAISAAFSVASGIGAGMQQKQAVQDQKRALRQQTAIQTEQNKKAAIQTIREARIRRAMIEAASVNTGAEGSGQKGALGSISSQAAASVGFQGMQAQSARNTTGFLNRASSSQGKANAFGQASDQFGNLFNFGQSLV